MKKPLNKLFSLGSGGKNKLSSDTQLMQIQTNSKKKLTKILKNGSFSYLWQPSKSKFS